MTMVLEYMIYFIYFNSSIYKVNQVFEILVV